ncbi:nucleolar protein 7-like [Actinia tenebrosa]|uniref:Nucleolar protein 7-like n=1 Tax=Actinia tenebrosa TaxID=6105 RepID=A0A6P8HVG2_ACTTE|nr:nucleolar protein 7-like [Actinia tenebrosa]
MSRVTRSSSKKAKLLENSKINEDKDPKCEEVPADSSEDVKRLGENEPDVISETEDDEAPESISLSASKEAAIAEIHKEKETVDSLREKEKQRRRERDEILKQQKESRKARELVRLPAEILEKVTKKQELDAKQQKNIKGAHVVTPKHVTFDSDDDDDNKEDKNNKEDENMTQVPVGEEPKGLQVVVLNQASKNTKRVIDSASEFLKNHFYGDRLKRVETLDDETQKRKHKKLEPAIKFSKNAGKR